MALALGLVGIGMGAARAAQPEVGTSLAATSGSASATPASSTTPDAGGLVSIEVRGDRSPPGGVTVTRSEARNLPGSFGDPLRTVEVQPGVVPVVSGLPSFFIRGAPPSNAGFFIDGVDVPLLYHAFFGPSVLHPALIQNVDLYRGVAPVEYGRFAGPVVAAGLSPFQERFGGELSLRAIDAGGFVEAPFGKCDGDAQDCSRGAARVSGRYSYTGLVLSLLSDTKLDYWDYQAQARYRLGDRDEIGILAFGGYDYFRANTTDGDAQGAKVDFHRIDLRYDRHAAGGITTRLALTAGYDRSAGSADNASAVSDYSLRLRYELATRPDRRVRLRAGFDARFDSFGLETYPLSLTYPDFTTLFPSRDEVVGGFYAATEVKFGPGFLVAPGVRADVYNTLGTTKGAVDPRLRAVFAPRGLPLTLEYTVGLSHQRANLAGQIPGAQVSALEGGLQEAVMASSELRWKLPADITASATVFRNLFYNVLDPIGGARDFGVDRSALDRRSTISAYGLEFSIARSLSRKLGGLIAYTLSRSEQTSQGRTTVSGYDRPHILQTALSYDFGLGIRGGVRTIYYSGVPEMNLEGYPHLTDQRRGAAFLRLDLRLEKRWRLGDGWVRVVGEVLNATGSREVIRLECGTKCVERSAGPVTLPSIGVEGGF